MTLEIGTDVGSYHILEQIGAGGMATVYRAHQTKLDRNVALKMIHANFSQDANFLARFEREARIVAKLDHPNIVPVYDTGRTDDKSIYVVSKFIEGSDLEMNIADYENSVQRDYLTDLMKEVEKNEERCYLARHRLGEGNFVYADVEIGLVAGRVVNIWLRDLSPLIGKFT